MPIVTRHSLITVVVLALTSVLIIGIFLWSGIYNIGADDTHTRPVYSMLQMLRERSITARAGKLHPPPNLDDAAVIRQGAGNYDAMCTGCHLKPGMEETELSKGLYPSPPNFSKVGVVDPAHHFWVIKHGIKASGMPAWGKSMEDDYIWGMVAFLQQLPKLDAAQYAALVASSGGHSHGGGETDEAHHHDEAGQTQHEQTQHEQAQHEQDQHDMTGMDMGESKDVGHEHAETAKTDAPVHTHADGKQHVHVAPGTSTTAAAKAPVKPAEPDPNAATRPPETAPTEHTDDHDHH